MSAAAHILVVEDDTDLAELVRDYLEADGHEVELCHDGSAGLARAMTGTHDLLLLDLMVPGTGGFDILRAYRRSHEKPVLLVSARGGDLDKIRGLGLGADDYVAKPFSPAELMARVKAHLSRYRRLTQQGADQTRHLASAGPLSLDAEQHRIFFHGTPLTLTAKEFDLLALFIHHPGRLFSKEELYQRVWGEGTAGDLSTVTVHVRKLREKLGERPGPDPAEAELIETVWGLGYRLREIG